MKFNNIILGKVSPTYTRLICYNNYISFFLSAHLKNKWAFFENSRNRVDPPAARSWVGTFFGVCVKTTLYGTVPVAPKGCYGTVTWST